MENIAKEKTFWIGLGSGAAALGASMWAYNKLASSEGKAAVKGASTGGKTVLLFGSGLMSPGYLEYIMEYTDMNVIVASNLIDEAKARVEPYKHRAVAVEVDISNDDKVDEQVEKADVVMSLLPPFLHAGVIKSCLRKGKSMVTASYNNSDYMGFDAEAKEKGITVLMECGLDPGIDILSTMKVKDEVEAEGGKIIEYESWCGGLPAAEDADNPLRYKISWSPSAVFKTCKNDATFLKDGKKVEYKGEDILTKHTGDLDFHKVMKL